MKSDAELEARLRAAVGRRAPGAAASIVGPEGVRAEIATGLAEIPADVPASVRMVCPWFSMTKIVTATVAMQLAESGVLHLDEPIHPLVVSFAELEPKEFAERITARHLLSHSAGLANPIPVTWIHRPEQQAPDPDTFLAGLLRKHRKIRFEPGTRSSYSNLGTLCLGSAIAKATGTPFTDLVRDRVLEPLRMRSTGFIFSGEMESAAATGYHPRWSPMRLLLPRWVIGEPAGRWVALKRFLLDGSAYGGLIGPVQDAARFLRMHLRSGELDGTRFITAESARTMREIRWQGRRFDLGLGWFRPANARDTDPDFVEHLGGGAGFFNVIRIYPGREVGIAVMGNATRYDIDAVARLALEN